MCTEGYEWAGAKTLFSCCPWKGGPWPAGPAGPARAIPEMVCRAGVGEQNGGGGKGSQNSRAGVGLLPAGDSSYLFWYQLLGQMREKGIVELVGELTSLTCRGYMQVSGAIGLQVAVPQPRVPCDQAPSWLASPTSLAMAPALQALWVAHQNSAWAPTVAVSPPWAHTSVSGAKIEMPAWWS